MQTTQRTFDVTAILVLYFFSRQNLEAFDISQAFLPLVLLQSHQLSKTVRLFGPPCTTAVVLYHAAASDFHFIRSDDNE